MGKLQPNFSWQKYEGKPEDQKEQFQYQLQNQHVQVANSVNATIDDLSYFTRPRMTSEVFVDGKAIWRLTVQMPTLPGAAGTVQAAHGIDFTKVNNVVAFEGIVYDPTNKVGAPAYYTNPTAAGTVQPSGIFSYFDGTNFYIQVGQNRNTFTNNYLTIWYTLK